MQRPQQPIPMYPMLDDETDMQQHQQTQMPQRPQQHPPRDHEEIPLHNMGFNRSVSETPERVRIRQIFNRVSNDILLVDLAKYFGIKLDFVLQQWWLSLYVFVRRLLRLINRCL